MKRVLHFVFLLSLSLGLLPVLEAQTIRYVKPDGTGTGTSWDDPGDFQNIINSANAGDSIFVAKGVYQPNLNSSFVMKDGVKIFGGFVGTETSLSMRVFTAGDSSILQGNGASVIDNVGNYLTSTMELDGFVITGGKSQDGGGMHNYGISPTIANCIFRGNKATRYGGGISIQSPNTPPFRLTNCIFQGNEAGDTGGGLFAIYVDVNFANCLFSNNVAPKGTQITTGYTEGSVTNMTLIGNDNGSSAFWTNLGVLHFKNSIIWGVVEGNLDANYSVIPSDNVSDELIGNIDASGYQANDIFTNFSGGDYSLLSTSPTVDAGTPDTTGLQLPVTDLAGNPRIISGIIDMGAFEYQLGGSVPVTLQSFSGHLQNGIAHLQWQSGLEAGFKQYELEKSKDGISYQSSALATLMAKGSNSSYSCTATQTEPIAFYRLKLTDYNGHIEYYKKIVSLNQKAIATSIKVYPNPTHSDLTIQTVKEGLIKIFDAAGRQVKTQQLKKGENSINLQKLSAGIYYAIFNGEKLQITKL